MIGDLTLDKSKLHGLSLGKAEIYGKPHVGAEYIGKSKRYHITDEACCVCGRAASNCHHVIPRGQGETFELAGHILRSPLFALCGSGTTGCHNGFHGGAYLCARWQWDDQDAFNAWWCGDLLWQYGAHSPMLYLFGEWHIFDTRTGKKLVIRELV